MTLFHMWNNKVKEISNNNYGCFYEWEFEYYYLFRPSQYLLAVLIIEELIKSSTKNYFLFQNITLDDIDEYCFNLIQIINKRRLRTIRKIRKWSLDHSYHIRN